LLVKTYSNISTKRWEGGIRNEKKEKKPSKKGKKKEARTNKGALHTWFKPKSGGKKSHKRPILLRGFFIGGSGYIWQDGGKERVGPLFVKEKVRRSPKKNPLKGKKRGSSFAPGKDFECSGPKQSSEGRRVPWKKGLSWKKGKKKTPWRLKRPCAKTKEKACMWNSRKNSNEKNLKKKKSGGKQAQWIRASEEFQKSREKKTTSSGAERGGGSSNSEFQGGRPLGKLGVKFGGGNNSREGKDRPDIRWGPNPRTKVGNKKGATLKRTMSISRGARGTEGKCCS